VTHYCFGVEPFGRPCRRSTAAAEWRDPGPFPGFRATFDTKSLAWALIRKGIHEVSIAAEARRRVVIKSIEKLVAHLGEEARR
jgi:hypothetical protein